MSKIIPFSELNRQHKINLLGHKQRDYLEREQYLGRLRKLLFQVEAQMRQAEMEQFTLYHEILENFQINVNFPNLGDRIGLQQMFRDHPALVAITEFLEGRLTAEECYDRLQTLKIGQDQG